MPIYNGGGGGAETDPSALKVANNLSDLEDVSDARSNLDVYSIDEVDTAIGAGGGGGGSYLPLAGGTMTGGIVFDGTSGQYISKGNFDTSRGGNYGISLVCSIGYEFNWQAGWLTTTEQNSVTPRPLYLDSLAGTTLRLWDSTTSKGTEVSHENIVINSDATYDSELGGWGLGVQQTDDNTKGTTVEFDGLEVYDGSDHMKVTPTGLTFPDTTTQTTAGYPLSGNPSGFLTSVPAKTVASFNNSTYTLSATDINNVVYCYNSGLSATNIIVIPTDATYSFSVGTVITLANGDSSNGCVVNCEYSDGGGNHPSINGGSTGISISNAVIAVKVAADTWFVS
jgi:hypothetical protein